MGEPGTEVPLGDLLMSTANQKQQREEDKDMQVEPEVQRLPQPLIPLYNGVVMFPDRKQRAALYGLLVKVLAVERRVRDAWRGKQSSQVRGKVEEETSDRSSWWAYASSGPRQQREKPSHAFLICQKEDPERVVDVANVGVALWRVRMWEGMGFDSEGEPVLGEGGNEGGGKDWKWVTPKRNRDSL